MDDKEIINDVANLINMGHSVWLYGEGDAAIARAAIEESGRPYETLNGAHMGSLHPTEYAAFLNERVAAGQAEGALLVVNMPTNNLERRNVDFLFGSLMTGTVIVGSGENIRMSAQQGNRITHLELKHFRKETA